MIQPYRQRNIRRAIAARAERAARTGATEPDTVELVERADARSGHRLATVNTAAIPIQEDPS